MKRYLAIFIISLCLSAASAQAQDGGIINKIIINGNQRIEDATIRSYLEINEGESYEQKRVNDSFKNLFSTGLFSDLNITREGNNLVINIVENPVINQVVFEGNRRIKDDELQSEIALQSRSVYTRSKVQNDVKRILNLYRKNGRFSVAVVPKAIQLDQNRVDIVFEIEEGKKTTVKRINFVGNKFFSDSKLQKTINTKESRWYSFISSGDTYDPDKVAFDKELLRKFYISKGYADFRVTSSVAEISKNKEAFTVTFTMEEGNKYKFGEINIDNTLADIDSEILKEKIQTVPNETFNADLVDKSVDDLTDYLNDLGYAFVDIKPQYNRDKENQVLAINFNIKEGPKVYVNRINIDGNVRTLDRVIRREFRIAEGDPYNAGKIRRSTQRIKNLGFFEDAKIQNRRTDAPDKVDIDVEVVEKSTGELNFGAGFSTTEGVLGNVSVRERNLLGKGQDLRVSFQQASRGTQLNLSFTEPYFINKDVAAGFDLFKIRRDLESESSFDSDTTGGTLRSSYSLSEHLRHSLRYSIRNEEITNVQDDASFFVRQQAGENTTSLVGHTLLYDKRDNKFDPTEGYFAQLSQEFAGVGGDSKFIKNEVRTGYYVPVFREEFVLALTGEVGNIFGYSDEDIRINQRFFVGGSKIRGFKNSGIGPRDSLTADALGGKTFYATTAEFGFPLGLGELGLRGATFVDAGSLYDTEEVGSNVLDESSVRASAGVGVAWSSPLGPIRIDWAKPFASEEFDREQQFRFNFGTRF